MRRGAWLVLVLAVPIVTGCESTQAKSARLEREAKGKLVEGEGVKVDRRNPEVRVVATTTLRDANGEAVVVRLRNKSRSTLAHLPIAVSLRNSGGKVVYSNATPGLERSLVEVPALPPGGELFWVNDQVVASGRVARVEARVGVGETLKDQPRVTLEGTHLERDSISGLAATGRAVSHSDLDQRRVPLFAVAERDGRVVAAGRGIIERLKPRKAARFTIFFIGDPREGTLRVAAAPTEGR